MSRHVATVPLTFQRFPITPGNSTRHARDMEPFFAARTQRPFLCRVIWTPRPLRDQTALAHNSSRKTGRPILPATTFLTRCSPVFLCDHGRHAPRRRDHHQRSRRQARYVPGFGEGLVGLMSKRFVCRFAVRQDGLAYSGVWRARRP